MAKSSLVDDMNSSLVFKLRELKDFDTKIQRDIETLEKTHPRLLFGLIYDNPLYEEIALRLFNSVVDVTNLYPRHIYGMYTCTKYGKKLIQDKYELFFGSKDIVVKEVIRVLFLDKEENMEILKKLSIYPDLHIRSLFMKELITEYPSCINDFYDDITKYYTFKDTQMDDKDISGVCADLYDSKLDSFIPTKEYILSNYKKNSLASEFIGSSDSDRFNAFKSDADRLFLSSKKHKIYLYNWYSKYLSECLSEQFARYVKMFRNDEGWIDIDNIYRNELGDKLEQLVDKYLSLSKRDDFACLPKGSTTAAYRIGDYCFKLSTTKWSYEDIICPDIFLILKDLEEIYVRNQDGVISAGIEVQPYLTRTANNIPGEIKDFWIDELDRLGYIYRDTLIKGEARYNNAMLLDSYKDANSSDPESLPDWFKEYPLVLIDRDMVYRKNEEQRLRNDRFR